MRGGLHLPSSLPPCLRFSQTNAEDSKHKLCPRQDVKHSLNVRDRRLRASHRHGPMPARSCPIGYFMALALPPCAPSDRQSTTQQAASLAETTHKQEVRHPLPPARLAAAPVPFAGGGCLPGSQPANWARYRTARGAAGRGARRAGRLRLRVVLPPAGRRPPGGCPSPAGPVFP